MEYKYEMHCHTSNVSMCGRVEIKNTVELYREKGYSGLVITDHYSPLTFYNKNLLAPQKKIDFFLSAYEECQKLSTHDFTILLGMELRHYFTGNDYLIYGIDAEWLKKQGNLMAIGEKKAYKLFHEAGCLVYQAHPFRPYIHRCNPAYIDGIEVFNGKCSEAENSKALKWANETGKLMISGSDFHTLKQTARGGIITQKPIKSNADLIEALRSMDFELIENY